jgi:hypothetical protein
MKKITSFILVVTLLLVCGCAYRHYLGMHGPSIKAYPDIHEDVKDDDQCLACHDPDNDPQGPGTSHPGFKGCFKCHND